MLSLRAERKSPQTLKNYGDGVRFYLQWCQDGSADPLARDSLRAWVAELLDAGMAPATIRARQLPVRRFAAWLAEEGEIGADPFVGLRSPKLDDKVVEPLTDDELRRLIAACQPRRAPPPSRRCGTAVTRPWCD
jgi:site-specific recombinase XerD